FRVYEALGGLGPRTRPVIDPDARYLALLDDVDAARVGRARVSPGDGIVTHGAAPRLQQAAHDREARVRRAIEIRDPARDLVTREKLRIDAVQAHRVAPAHRGIHVGGGVDEVQHAARAVHHVEVEFP